MKNKQPSRETNEWLKTPSGQPHQTVTWTNEDDAWLRLLVARSGGGK